MAETEMVRIGQMSENERVAVNALSPQERKEALVQTGQVKMQNADAALNSNKTWLVQRVSYDGKQVWAEITVVAENWMAAKAAAVRVFDYRDQRSGLMVAEHLIHGKNDHDGYIIPSAADAAKDWQRAIDEGLI